MSRNRAFHLAVGMALSIAALSCGNDGDANSDGAGGGISPPLPAGEIDEFGLFSDARKQIPAEGVIPFDVIASLYADEALKHRFVRIPEGKQIGYRDDGNWDWPDGAILIKTFSFPIDARDPALGERHIETRLLIKEEGAWTARTYLWDEAQTTTTRLRVGALVPVSFIDDKGETRSLDYRVPNENQCTLCHSTNHVMEPLGPRTRQLARAYDYGDGEGPVDQIDHFAKIGILGGEIPSHGARPKLVAPFGDAPLEDRALSYLEVNCAHCHRPGGAAAATNLLLGVDVKAPYDYGVCRTPVATGPASGGHFYDIVPGKPDESILLYRMASTAPEIKMPQLPTQTYDEAGVALIREWIAKMTFPPCGPSGD